MIHGLNVTVNSCLKRVPNNSLKGNIKPTAESLSFLVLYSVPNHLLCSKQKPVKHKLYFFVYYHVNCFQKCLLEIVLNVNIIVCPSLCSNIACPVCFMVLIHVELEKIGYFRQNHVCCSIKSMVVDIYSYNDDRILGCGIGTCCGRTKFQS